MLALGEEGRVASTREEREGVLLALGEGGRAGVLLTLGK